MRAWLLVGLVACTSEPSLEPIAAGCEATLTSACIAARWSGCPDPADEVELSGWQKTFLGGEGNGGYSYTKLATVTVGCAIGHASLVVPRAVNEMRVESRQGSVSSNFVAKALDLKVIGAASVQVSLTELP